MAGAQVLDIVRDGQATVAPLMKRGMALKAVNGEDVRGQPYKVQLDAINCGMDASSERGVILSFARDMWPSEGSKYEPPSISGGLTTDNPTYETFESES